MGKSKRTSKSQSRKPYELVHRGGLAGRIGVAVKSNITRRDFRNEATRYRKERGAARPVKPFYKRRVLEINLLRLLGARLSSFGPEVALPPKITDILYGLIRPNGVHVTVLNENAELLSAQRQEQAPKAGNPVSVCPRTGTQSIYTDGSYYRRYERSGYAVWWDKNHEFNACGPVPTKGPLSSAKSEEYAIFLALLEVKAEVMHSKRRVNYEIFTDASWVKDDILRWHRKWSKRNCTVGWKTSPTSSTEHREILRVAAGLLWDLRFQGVRISLKYVKGHNGTFGNEIADFMAKLGSQTEQFFGPRPAIILENRR